MSPSYRPARDLSDKLSGHARNLLDEDHFLGLISFLSNLLYSGTSLSPNAQYIAFKPPADILLVLSTIVVHPLFTNRATSSARAEAAGSALRLLFDINTSIGPVNAGYADALYFRSEREQRRSIRRHPAQLDIDSDSNEDSPITRSKSKYLTTESLWSQVDDLWSVVGWAFTCSLNHQKRWEYWILWLNWYLDAMEKDWNQRAWLAEQATNEHENIIPQQGKAEDSLLKSLIYRDLSRHGNRTGLRRILRSILADGVSHKPLNEFREVWVNETKERMVEDQGDAPQKILNLEEGQFGDYDVDDDEDRVVMDDGDMSPVRGSDARPSESLKGPVIPKDIFELGTASLGGINALELRQRLLALVFEVSTRLPIDFAAPESIFDVFTEFMTYSTTAQFAVLLSNAHLKPKDNLILLINLLIPLAQVAEPRGGIFMVGNQDLMQYYLPAAASSHSAIENNRVSLIVETMLKNLMMIADEVGTENIFGETVQNGQLGEAIETGVKSRERKVNDDLRRRKVADSEESRARDELASSSRRIMLLLEAIEAGLM